jgi:uncharacterized protein (TIGR03067 family)
MRLSLCAAVALLVGVGYLSAADKDDAAKKEMKKLEGTWKVVKEELNGSDLPLSEDKPTLLILKGDRFTLKIGDTVEAAGTGVVDATKKPRTVDLTLSEGSEKGQTMKAIYELKGDELRVCIAPPGKERPTEFSSKDGCMLLVTKRAKS